MDIVGSIAGIYYGVDGPRRGCCGRTRALAAQLGGHTLNVPPDMRVFYHAACVVASNHLTALLAVLESMYAKLGDTRNGFFPVFKPIIMATLKNVESTSPADALSGPVARGGTETVAQHLKQSAVMRPGCCPISHR